MTIKEGDFVTIVYTGRLEDGMIFDTTDKALAEEAGLDPSKVQPRVICVGQQHILPKLDEALVGKEPTASFSLTLSPEEAFGKKNAKLIQLIAANKFKKSDMQPYVGMQVTVDNRQGVVRRVGGGRVLVDFNHPLANKTVSYTITLQGLVTDVTKQVQTLAHLLQLGQPDVSVHEGVATLGFDFVFPEELQGMVKEQITSVITSVKDVTFTQKQKPTKT